MKKSFIKNLLNQSHFSTYLLFYLYLILFIFQHVDFFTYEKAYAHPIPFGNGPWLCVNKLCPGFDTPIAKCTRYEYHTYITGIFECSTCGLRYLIRNGVKSGSISAPFVIDHGFLFNEKIVQYRKSGMRIIDIAEKLETSKNTVAKVLRGGHKGTYHSVEKMISKSSTDFIELKKKALRREILNIFNDDKEKDNFSREYLRRVLSNNYTWMLKHDLEWIELLLPPSNVGKRKSIDITMEDKEMKLHFQQVLNEMKQSNTPKRISRSNIIRSSSNALYINRLSIGPNRWKYIETNRFLEESSESEDDYLKRTIIYAIQLTLKKYNSLTKSYFLLTNYRMTKCSPEALEWLELQINNYNEGS